MAVTLLVIYLCGWLPITFAAYAAARRLTERRSPPDHQLMVSTIAGAIWPLLVVGLVELSSIMVFTKARPKPETSVGISA
jgi:hypothetical protein